MDCSTDEFQCLCDSWSSISRMSFFRPPKDWLTATETGQSRSGMEWRFDKEGEPFG